jgi:hypothetical protein
MKKFWMRLSLAAFSFGVCAVAFVTVDWVRTTELLRRHSVATSLPDNPCRLHDPMRDHSYKPNCHATAQWGGDSYAFSTNSIGLRDREVRDLSAVGGRPRVLLLGDSFTEGMTPWKDTYAAMLAARFPQYEILNGGVIGYSPSTYLNTARLLLQKGIQFDEVIVFVDISDVQDEAAIWQDVGSSGAVGLYPRRPWVFPQFEQSRDWVAHHLLLTDELIKLGQRALVASGYYHLTIGLFGNVFDMGWDAWTYREVDETRGFYEAGGAGYAPLGVEGGVIKAQEKMRFLWEDLKERGIPLSVVVHPHPAQLAHDTVDSRQVLIWRSWCEGKCKRFINVFPAFFAARDKCPWFERGCWYGKYFIFGDVHYNGSGNALEAKVVGDALAASPVEKRRHTILSNAAAPSPAEDARAK